MATWTEDKPQMSDIPNADLASLITGNKVAFRTAVEHQLYWTQSSNASSGVPQLSDGSFGPGSARAFFDVESNVSISVASTKALSGRLYITSDSSELYGFTSTATIPLGSKNAVVQLVGTSWTTMPTNSRILVQSGSTVMSGAGPINLTFPTAYSATPASIKVIATGGAATDQHVAAVTAVNASGISIVQLALGGTASTTVYWRSVGTVTL